MVDPTPILLGSVCGAIGLWHGYRALTALLLSRSLSAADSYSSTGMVDGETAAVEGEVIVDEPPAAADSLGEAADSLAAVVWRASYPKTGNEYTVDFENRSIRRKTQTFASGFETGTFKLDDGVQTLTVDPTWLTETHRTTPLSELSATGLKTSSPVSDTTWDSPYVHLTEHSSKRTFDEIPELVETDGGDSTSRNHYFESRAIHDGDTLAVRGEVQIDQGAPVIQGTDETPLALSDDGFDGLGADLKRQLLKYGVLAVALLAVSVVLLLRGIGAI